MKKYLTIIALLCLANTASAYTHFSVKIENHTDRHIYALLFNKETPMTKHIVDIKPNGYYGTTDYDTNHFKVYLSDVSMGVTLPYGRRVVEAVTNYKNDYNEWDETHKDGCFIKGAGSEAFGCDLLNGESFIVDSKFKDTQGTAPYKMAIIKVNDLPDLH